MLTGYIVRFEKDSQKSNDEYFIRNSDVAINENTFESESIEDFKAFPVEINDQSTLALDNIVNRRERKKEPFIICIPFLLLAETLHMALGHYENRIMNIFSLSNVCARNISFAQILLTS